MNDFFHPRFAVESDASIIRRQELEKELTATLTACPCCGKQPKFHFAPFSGCNDGIDCQPCGISMTTVKGDDVNGLIARWNRMANYGNAA